MMIDQEVRQFLHTVWSHFGMEAQLRKCQEECRELIEAIDVYLTQVQEESESHVVEEMVDVAIMITQMVNFFGEEPFSLWLKIKMRRLPGIMAQKQG